MKEMVCIVCPNSCRLMVEEADGQIHVTGNQCNRGESFAKTELTSPVRTFSTTVCTAWPSVPVLPVRVSKEVPRDKIFAIMDVINHITVRNPVRRGDVIVENVLGLGADVIATSDCLWDVLSEEEKEYE